ncbi:MAG: inverse autotransporter beta domain-containing protein [Thermodesulfobacteriota bacterium]
MYRIISIVILLWFVVLEASPGFAYGSNRFSKKSENFILANTTLFIAKDQAGASNIKITRLQPLYQDSRNNLAYTQLNTKVGGTQTLLNTQLGYRTKAYKRSVMGLNVFYDLLKQSHFNRNGMVFYRRGTGVHRWGGGIEAFNNKYGVRANAFLASADSFTFKGIRINSRVSEGYNIEAGGSFFPCKDSCKVFASYQWFNKLRHRDYRTIGAKMNVAIYRGIQMNISYSKELDSGTDGDLASNDIFVTFTVDLDRFANILQSERYKRYKQRGGRKLLTHSFSRLNPFKIEGSLSRDSQ